MMRLTLSTKVRSYLKCFSTSIVANVLMQFGRSAVRNFRLAEIRSRNPTLQLEIPCSLIFDNIHAFHIGENVSIGAFSEIVVLENSPFSPVNGALEIGDRVVIGKGANIRAAGGRIAIGEGALLAQDVSLIAANHLAESSGFYRDQPWDSNRVGVEVNRNVWIGAGVIVLPGVVIGENSVIAAGSVVTKNVPKNQLWGGVPARCINEQYP